MCLHKYTNDKNNHKVVDQYHYTAKYKGATHSICNLKYSIPKNYSVVYHNGLNYDYHFIIKEVTKEFEEELPCLV